MDVAELVRFHCVCIVLRVCVSEWISEKLPTILFLEKLNGNEIQPLHVLWCHGALIVIVCFYFSLTFKQSFTLKPLQTLHVNRKDHTIRTKLSNVPLLNKIKSSVTTVASSFTLHIYSLKSKQCTLVKCIGGIRQWQYACFLLYTCTLSSLAESLAHTFISYIKYPEDNINMYITLW